MSKVVLSDLIRALVMQRSRIPIFNGVAIIYPSLEFPQPDVQWYMRCLLNSLYVNRVNEKQCDKSDLPVPIDRILGQAGFGRQKQEMDAQRLLDDRNVHARALLTA